MYSGDQNSTGSSQSSARSPTVFSNQSSSGSRSIALFQIAKPIGEVQRLSDKEWQVRREKGLCFKCDGKWQVGHRCNKKELSVLLSQEEGDDEGSLPLSPSTESEDNGGT